MIYCLKFQKSNNMATINEMKEAINGLINSDGAVDIPGLDFDSVVDNMVETDYKEQLDDSKTKEERDDKKKSLVKYYKEKAGAEIEQNINIIKSNFAAAKDGLIYVAEAAAATVASNVIPSVITTGAAASVANQAYVMIENKQKKNTLLGILKNIGNFIVNLLSAAVKILFAVPEMIMSLIKTLTTTKSVVNSIPV